MSDLKLNSLWMILIGHINGKCLFFIDFFMDLCPGTMTTHAESINPDLQTFTTHTTLNTEQNQLSIKVSTDN